MREIDFRMWDSTTKKYFHDPGNVFNCLKQQSLSNKKLGFLAFNHIANGRVFEQYTGLKDRNGKKIFEGDIIKHPDIRRTLVIEWDKGNGTWSIGRWWAFCEFYYGNISDLEIVGNIHENPEMVNS